jgi:hypothetical protein
MPDFKHFFLTNTATSEKYTATGGGSGTFRSPPRDSREAHGKKLVEGLEKARKEAATREQAADPNIEGLVFVPLAVEGEVGELDNRRLSGIDLEKFDSESKGIRIINVREEEGRQVALVAIPKNQLDYFERKLTDYLEKDDVRERKDGTISSKPKNQKLVESISDIRLGLLRDYYTDQDGNPPGLRESIWWEVWLEFIDCDETLNEFKSRAEAAGINFSDQFVRFPEVTVILAKGTLEQWSQVDGLFRNLAEFRRAKIVASEFIELAPADQAEFIEDLLGRTTFAGEDAPAVTILDTGVNRGHPLLAPALDQRDLQAAKESWHPNDVDGHGTEIAGIALFGPRLKELLLPPEEVTLEHRLESVKILPDDGDNKPPDYAPITVQAMKKAESVSPNRNRVFCMSITADDRDEFLPTLWSAAIDQAVSGKDDKRRLFVVSAGNLFSQPGERYPDVNHLASVQDPAQSWNAVTAGAYTELWRIEEDGFDGWSPVAPKGRLCPASTTSIGWREQAWPIKPEIVLEGGNFASDGDGGYSDVPDLSLLTTRLAPTGALLGLTRATSPAAGQAARMAAIVQAAYPDYWPETVRGMLVHNARWTKEMRDEFPVTRRAGNITKIPKARLRAYGWGVPDLDKCLSCSQHFATMVIQDTIQPYSLGDDGKPITNEMRFHALPIPKAKFEEYGDEEVEMRVTLSYFIEPSPGRKGWNVKHRYASHGLRFEVIRPLEDHETFKKRISRDFWDGGEDESESRVRPRKGPDEDRHWAIGEFGQTKGSIHSDFWRGTASQLAESGAIAVFPVTGWWRERLSQECISRLARYSLIVTIQTRRTDLEVYSWVSTEISPSVEVDVET